MDALREAAIHTQVLVTTHSPDLLEQIDSSRERVLVVQARKGTTEIAPLDKASREAIERHLYSAGEMLRMDQLEPDRQDLDRQLKLFKDGDDE
jgi:predicted ATP-dependent endonuclease of OLD family